MDLSHNTPICLYEIWRHFEEMRWVLPPHQRKLVWDKQKMAVWFKDLRAMSANGGGTVPGCIIIYEFQGRTYLNDGAQRVYWTIKQFIDDCKKKDHNWKDILHAVRITVQQVKYKDIAEAIRNFIQINFGTTATPHELSRTMFCQQFDDYVEYWEPRLAKIHEAVRVGMLALGCKPEDRTQTDKRDIGHKRTRDEYHLFWKVISGDDTQFSPPVACSNLKPDNWDSETKLERYLLDLLNKLGHKGIEEAVHKFEIFVQQHFALYTQIWLEKKPATSAPSNVHVRWWLIACAYLDNHRVTVKAKREFTEKLIDTSDGRTTLFYVNEDGQNCNCNLAMSKLQHFKSVAKIIDFDHTRHIKQKRLKSKESLKPGFHDSHVDGFSATGGTKTLPENSIENLHRSGRDMKVSEQDRLELVYKKRSKSSG